MLSLLLLWTLTIKSLWGDRLRHYSHSFLSIKLLSYTLRIIIVRFLIIVAGIVYTLIKMSCRSYISTWCWFGLLNPDVRAWCWTYFFLNNFFKIIRSFCRITTTYSSVVLLFEFWHNFNKIFIFIIFHLSKRRTWWRTELLCLKWYSVLNDTVIINAFYYSIVEYCWRSSIYIVIFC